MQKVCLYFLKYLEKDLLELTQDDILQVCSALYKKELLVNAKYTQFLETKNPQFQDETYYFITNFT